MTIRTELDNVKSAEVAASVLHRQANRLTDAWLQERVRHIIESAAINVADTKREFEVAGRRWDDQTALYIFFSGCGTLACEHRREWRVAQWFAHRGIRG